MKLITRSNGLYLEGIQQNDIRFANLAGRMTGSPYDDPKNPKHVYVVWIDDPGIVQAMMEQHVNVTEKPDVDDPKILRHSIQLKAYPKMRVNRNTGKEEQYPKVMLRTTQKTVRLDQGAFGLVDSAHVESVDIRLHTWQYDQRKPDQVAVIDELWLTVDEGAGEQDESYLDEKYGYSEPEIGEDEVPFQ
jgi:hypothetical protein